MKLEKIRFKNINSLRGEHLLSFDESPLLDAGLFAITGATGSGKSTILDVITLALYNYVPRLGKISKTTIEKMGSIVTHFMDEAWAEIEYTVNEQRYLSRWSISKTRNDTYREYDMDIVLLPQGTSIGLKKGQIPAKNEELIGLTHDQFLKSILLSQGEFSRFLQAKKDERSKLLEDITGTTIYRDLGILAYQKTKAKKDEVDRLRENITMLTVLSKEEVSSYKQEIERTNKELVICQSTRTSLTRARELHKDKKLIEQTKVSISTREASLSEQIKSSEREKKLLDDHLVAKNYEEHILSLERNMTASEKLNGRISQQREILAQTQAEKKDALHKMQKFIQQDIVEASFYDEMAAFEKKVSNLDAQLTELKNNGVTVRNRITKINQSQQFDIIGQLEGKVETRTAIGLIETRLAQIDIRKDSNIDLLQKELTELSDKKSVGEKFLSSYQEHVKFTSKLQELERLLENQGKQLGSIQTEFDLKLKEQVKHEQRLKATEAKLTIAKEKADLDAYRELLEDGKPCPLCGSEHHPYKHEQELAELGLLTLEYDKQKSVLEEIKLDSIQLQKNLLLTESDVKSTKQKIVDSKIQQDFYEERLELIKQQHVWTKNVLDNQWAKEIDALGAKLIATKMAISQLSEYQYLQTVLEEFGQLQQVTIAYQKLDLERKAYYTGTDVHRDADNIQNQFTKAISAIQTSEKAITTIEQEIGETKQSIELAKAALIPLQEQYSLSEPTLCKDLILSNQLLNQFQAHMQTVNNEQAALKALKADIKTKENQFAKELSEVGDVILLLLDEKNEEELQTALIENEQEIKSHNIELGKWQNIIQHDNQQKLKVKTLKENLSKLESDNKVWILLSELIGDGKGKKFSNYAQDLTLVHLLTRANARLETLSDRYVLSFRPDEEDLLVIDRYQGDTERAVKTLSGGETFLISLALALSLSDFASKRVQLESLFIDEGFGTLDQETLDIAMSTLEKLQHASGKRIGIISHVESLKERINTQIRVHKSSQGYSDLEVVV